ncbi:MAG: ribosomal-processing cysteine protease Prp [Firmicutes bacterium]|nr:ribosomal-processing cysteine protease Prp [Bacillota bacterium]
MISVRLFYNKNGAVYGFEAEGHGLDIVCSAVSALTFNTVNSVEAFAGEELSCDCPENGGGWLRFSMPRLRDGGENRDAELLTASLALGLRSLAEEYPKEIRIKEIKTREAKRC